MIYNDGVEIDDKRRVVKCPCCNNAQFTDDARFCRICGQLLFNCCEGSWDEDANGYGNGDTVFHNNPGNARFCEICGKKTQYFIDGFLKPWGDVFNNDKTGIGDSPTYRNTNKLPELVSGLKMPKESVSKNNIDIDEDDLPF